MILQFGTLHVVADHSIVQVQTTSLNGHPPADWPISCPHSVAADLSLSGEAVHAQVHLACRVYYHQSRRWTDLVGKEEA